jgi:predicted negative regulator of RcsB-dependent stress response
MKRTERRHLKDNELASLAATARQTLEEHRGQLTALLVAVVVIGAAAVGYFAWRGSVQGRAHALLADAIAVEEARVGPPAAPGTPSTGLSFDTEREKHQAALTKFKVVADEYPATDAGLFAGYREAATWMALGNPKEAVTAYQQVIDRAGDTIYGQMARLGQAQAQVQAGQFDSAITTYKEMAQRKDGPLPVDGILIQLGRTYIDAGKPSEAQQTFNRLVQEFPDSPFSGDAKRELDTLKKT